MNSTGISLYVDDLRDAPSADWIVARSSEEAIALLARGDVVRLSLDHDLGGEDTAMRVVDWLDERCFADPAFALPETSVHSANPVGAARLRAAIDAIRRRQAGH